MKCLLTLLIGLLVAACASTHTPCKGNIGIYYSKHSHIIAGVLPDSPADKAGLEIGDHVIAPKSIPGPTNTETVVEFYRAGVLQKRKVTRKCLRR